MSRGELRAVVGESRLSWIREQAEAYEISEADVLRRVIDFARGAGPTPPVVHQPSMRGGVGGESSPGEGEVRGSGEGGGVTSIEEILESVPQSSGKAKRRRRTPQAEPPAFAEFYEEIYPRKQKREAARAAWLKAEKEGALPSLEVLRSVVAQQINENDWANPEKVQFIPLPSSWINGKRWNDKPLRGAVLVQPKPDPAALAAAERKQARDRAENAYREAARQLVFYDGSTDNWRGPATSWLYDGLGALQELAEFEARLTHAQALIERLRGLGAFPLVKAPAGTAPGLIFPACGGGPWRPSVNEEGWLIDTGTESALTPAMVGSGPAIDRVGRPLDDPYGSWKVGNPNWPIIDDPVSPDPSPEKLAAAHERLVEDGLVPEYDYEGELLPWHPERPSFFPDPLAAKCPRCGAAGEIEAETMCRPGIDECPMTQGEWPLAGSASDPNVLYEDEMDRWAEGDLSGQFDDYNDVDPGALYRDRSEP